MSNKNELAIVVYELREDCQAEWPGIFGLELLPIVERGGSIALNVVAKELVDAGSRRDNPTAFHCIWILARLRKPEADDALADTVLMDWDDEVIEEFFEDAIDSPSLLRHQRFITAARQLIARRPLPPVRDFLEKLGTLADPCSA